MVYIKLETKMFYFLWIFMLFVILNICQLSLFGCILLITESIVLFFIQKTNLLSYPCRTLVTKVAANNFFFFFINRCSHFLYERSEGVFRCARSPDIHQNVWNRSNKISSSVRQQKLRLMAKKTYLNVA